jgi:hypothetical protein
MSTPTTPTTPPAPGAPTPPACGPTWHRLAMADGDHIWFRFIGHMHDQYGTFIYRMAPVPDERLARTIWCYGDHGVPWRCDLCGRDIAGPAPG